MQDKLHKQVFNSCEWKKQCCVHNDAPLLVPYNQQSAFTEGLPVETHLTLITPAKKKDNYVHWFINRVHEGLWLSHDSHDFVRREQNSVSYPVCLFVCFSEYTIWGISTWK